MVYIDFDGFVSILWILFMSKQVLGFLFLDLDKFPDVVLRNVVRCVWTARYFIVNFAFRMFDFMGVEIVLCFEVAENDWLI